MLCAAYALYISGVQATISEAEEKKLRLYAQEIRKKAENESYTIQEQTDTLSENAQHIKTIFWGASEKYKEQLSTIRAIKINDEGYFTTFVNGVLNNIKQQPNFNLEHNIEPFLNIVDSKLSTLKERETVADFLTSESSLVKSIADNIPLEQLKNKLQNIESKTSDLLYLFLNKYLSNYESARTENSNNYDESDEDEEDDDDFHDSQDIDEQNITSLSTALTWVAGALP